MDEICTKIELLHLDDIEGDKFIKIKHLPPNFNDSSYKKIGRHSKIQKNMLKTGQKRKVHEACRKISPKQKVANSEYVAETTEIQCLDEQIDVENNTYNTKSETKTVMIPDLMLNLTPKYKTASSNLLDWVTPVSSIASAATTLPIFFKRLTGSKTESLLRNESSNACVSKSQTLLQSTSMVYFIGDIQSLSPYQLQSLIMSKSQDVFKTKSSTFSKDASFSDFTTKSLSYKRPLSPNVYTCKSQSTLRPDSFDKHEFSQLNIAKPQKALKMNLTSFTNEFSGHLPTIFLNQNSQSTSRTDLLFKQKFSKPDITKSQRASKMKISLISESSVHLPALVTNQNSSLVSIKRFKRQQRHLLKKIKLKKTSIKVGASKLKKPKNLKVMESNKKQTSAIEKSQIENSSRQKVKNIENRTSSIKFVVRDLRNSCPPIVNSISHSIKKNTSVVGNVTDLNRTLETCIDSKYGLKNISVNQNTVAASMSTVHSKCNSRKRIIYDEKSEEKRKRTMSVIKEKQKLLKNIIKQGKYFQNRNIKEKLILKAETIQLEIDLHFQNIDELGKMPNYLKPRRQVKPKVKKEEHIKSLQTLLLLLGRKIGNKVNIENVYQFLNFEIVEEAFCSFKNIKRKDLKRIEVSKHKMNLDLQDLVNYLKLNRGKIFSNVSLPNIHDIDIFNFCESLRKAVERNLRHLLRLRFLTSNLMKSIQSYRTSEKLLFSERNSFVYKEHENFFTLRKVK